ncbi:MAG: hypothetical protein KC609_00605 [Myxococcales bacterium]|nr:hypothetical protein [Myxococcales bacterium]
MRLERLTTTCALALLFVAASIGSSWARATQHGKKRIGELERLGPKGRDALVLGLDAPGFDALPKNERIFAYYLSRAAIAGNDILYKQNHRHAFAIKQLLEQLYHHRAELPKPIATHVHDYLKYVWIHHGQYDHRTGEKFVPNALTFAELKRAAEIVKTRGGRFDFLAGATLEAKLETLKSAIFDKSVEPHLTVTAKGKDIIKESAVNLFDPGVTQALLDAVPRALRDQLNVRFALEGNTVVAQVFKIGGLYDRELRTVAYWLKKAAPLAQTSEQRKGIEALVRFFETGDEKLFREHSVHWLKSDNRIDYLAGFIEQLKDPRGVIGNWEGMVSFAADSRLIGRIAEQALYFEGKMPWPAVYKRSSIKKPVSNVVHVLVGTGDMGPVPWAGYNLPNYADIRRDVGSKNVILLNILQAGSEKDRQREISEFYLPPYRRLVMEHGKLFRRMLVYLHEVIGHASGQPDKSLKGDPRVLIGRSFSSLEECRADLIALYHFGDPKIRALINDTLPKSKRYTAEQWRKLELGMYIWFLQGHQIGLRTMRDGVVKGAHRRAEHAIYRFVTQNGGSKTKDYGAKVVKRGGKYFVAISDPAKVHRGLRDLLVALQVTKSTGNAKEANRLFDRFGTNYDPAVQKNVKLRAARLGMVKNRVVVYPRLVPVLKGGKLVDVKLAYDETLTDQQLRFSRLSGKTE